MSGGDPAGSSRALRLDPFALPVRFTARDERADGQCREVELTRERVVVRRSRDGIKMAINLPVSAYRGVALRMVTGEDGSLAASVVLAHIDPGLDLVLCTSDQAGEVVEAWHDWAWMLQMPILQIEDTDPPAVQDNNPPEPEMAAEPAKPVESKIDVPPKVVRMPSDFACARRRRRNAIRSRRPSIMMRRQVTRVGDCSRYGGEQEIIARE